MTAGLSDIYGRSERILEAQRKRFQKAMSRFKAFFGGAANRFFSAPGRTEIGGNHTDHNQGLVLAASVNLDAIAAVRKRPSRTLTVFSEGYAEPFIVDLSDLSAKKQEAGTTTALLRGIAARFVELGYAVGGLDAFLSSEVLPGSGLSSSAAIEVLVATILNGLYNGGKIPPETIATIGQFAENTYFEKPCGLMDQMASAVGGAIKLDFAFPDRTKIEKISLNLEPFGYSMLIVNTGGSHANLTSYYAAIPAEMKKVAGFFGKKVLREISRSDVLEQIGALREAVGDRAVLRALHFFEENERVRRQADALKAGQFARFLEEIRDSGNSSWKWLQNVTAPQNPQEQGLALALALTEDFIRQVGEGACRVHGGGFAGTIQVFLPRKAVGNYRRLMEGIFGKGTVLTLSIRPIGATEVSPD